MRRLDAVLAALALGPLVLTLLVAVAGQPSPVSQRTVEAIALTSAPTTSAIGYEYTNAEESIDPVIVDASDFIAWYYGGEGALEPVE